MSATRPASRLSEAALGLGRLARRAGGVELRRPTPRMLAALAAGLVLLVAGWLWLRDSSLVAVRTVEVTGIAAGTDGARVRAALEEAGRSMTTLHVRQDALASAVAPFSVVKGIEVSTGFPHTLRVHVVTNVAVGAVLIDGLRIAVTAEGTLLRDVRAASGLPTIPVRLTPGGRRLTEPAALAAVAALGAAPGPLRTRVARVFATRTHGLSVQLAHGPALWFDDASRLSAKWTAASAVLADPASAGASYVDVSVPEHPAVGGLPEGAQIGQSDVPTPPPGSTAGAASAPAATTPSGGTAPTATAPASP